MLKDSPPITPKPSFEDCYPIINTEINKRRHKWTLTAISWMDFDDVAQVIKIHIHKKWHLWDHTLPLEPWIARIINHQMYNISRNNYKSFSRPCLDCPANEGGESCSLYGTQNTQCPMFLQWVKSKKRAHDIRLPLPIENHQTEVFSKEHNAVDVIRTADEIHKKMKEYLRPRQWLIYSLMFIEYKTDEEIAKVLKYKTSESNRKDGYRPIHNSRKKFITKVNELLKNDEINIFFQ